MHALAAPVEIVPPDLRDARQPQVAVAPNGSIHIAFGKMNLIYYVASTDGGKTFSEPVIVGELPKLALGMRRGPRIVATTKTLAISAISFQDGNLHGWFSQD
ncbi:MAG: exo-alpha-sialidase, partial [Gloeobacteraceae cyanobacterium ES-bin-144]|nr:exo-alpha-sialidase [Verrucomicrobiales bacterium]